MKKHIIFLTFLLFLCSFTFAQKELTLEKVTVVSRHITLKFSQFM